jgi:hypothetical protein
MTLCRCDDERGVEGEPRLVMSVIAPCGEEQAACACERDLVRQLGGY